MDSNSSVIVAMNKKYLDANPYAVIIPCPDAPDITEEYKKGVYAVQDKMETDYVRGFGKPQYARDLPLRHSFAEGMYQRELFIPKGMFLVSELHRDSYFSWVREGELSMITDKGLVRVKAPCAMTSPLGCKRMLYAHEDSWWITVHPNPTNTTDIEELEAQIHVLEGRYEILEDKLKKKEEICRV